MKQQFKGQTHDRAKEMMIKGESWDKIMEETKLREKDLKRIQMHEIDPKF